MTAATKQSTPQSASRPRSLIRYYSAEIEVLYEKDHGFSFVVKSSDGIVVDRNGDIHIPWLQENEGARISFRLSDRSDASELADIRIFMPDSSVSEPAVPRPHRVGDPYPGTFFEISRTFASGLLEVITLTETRTGAALVQPFWYRYEISVVDAAGNLQYHDPRIYNKGDNPSAGAAGDPDYR